MNEMQKYDELVKKFIAIDSDEIFGNYDIAHARCVITNFIASAQNSIEILTGRFSDSFYNRDIINLITAATKRGVSVRIISISRTRSPFDENKLIHYINANYNGQDPISHFIVVDKKRYRLEAPHADNRDEPEVVEAEVCCNGQERAGKLLSFFNAIWTRLT